MQKKKIFLIILLAIACVFGAIFVNRKLCEASDMNRYSKGMAFYKSQDYQNAYYQFSQVSNFSVLKSAALFRQARSATLVGDNDSAKRNYNILLTRYSNSPLAPVSEYNLAVLLYQQNDLHAAQKHFKHLIRHDEDTDYAKASEYYLGLMDTESLSHMINYIVLSPNGRYAQKAIDKISASKVKLSNSDNLKLANSFLKQEKYPQALTYYKKTSLKYSWAGYAKADFKTGKYDEAKKFVDKGLSMYSSFGDKDSIYSAIDSYLSLSNSKRETIGYLLKLNPNSNGADYLMYLDAKYAPVAYTPQKYEKLFKKFPNSQFTGEALYKTFYSKIDEHKYQEAIRLGQLHLANFGDTNSAPAVMYWMGKLYEKCHQPDMAEDYYRGVLEKYPDSYYSMRANSKLNHNALMLTDKSLKVKPVVFPINNKSEKELVLKLAELGDYDFVSEIYKEDGFVQSWVEYKKGNYTHSNLLAREAMENVNPKPNFKDVRWRLVYPVHYYDYVKQYCNRENPIIILSIIKEESHFNPTVQSPVGALGLMQLMPGTGAEIAKAYGVQNNLLDAKTNIRLGCLYYAKMRRSLNDKDMSAIMAYNGGWASVTRWKKNLDYVDFDDFVEKIPYPETQDYLRKVLKSYWNYSNIYR